VALVLSVGCVKLLGERVYALVADCFAVTIGSHRVDALLSIVGVLLCGMARYLCSSRTARIGPAHFRNAVQTAAGCVTKTELCQDGEALATLLLLGRCGEAGSSWVVVKDSVQDRIWRLITPAICAAVETASDSYHVVDWLDVRREQETVRLVWRQ
jgi:hypothetical protein